MPSATSRPKLTTFTTAVGSIRQQTGCRRCGTKLRLFKNTLCRCPGLLDHYTLTFFAAAKKDKQRKRLKPLMLSGHRGLPRVVVRLESVFVHLHAPVTRASTSGGAARAEEFFITPLPSVALLWREFARWLLAPLACKKSRSLLSLEINLDT